MTLAIGIGLMLGMTLLLAALVATRDGPGERWLRIVPIVVALTIILLDAARGRVPWVGLALTLIILGKLTKDRLTQSR